MTTPSDRGWNLWALISAFLYGIVVGGAGFAFLAARSGLLNSGALVVLLFPFLACGLVIASLPMCVPQVCETINKVRSIRKSRESQFRRSEPLLVGLAEPRNAADSR